MNQLDMILNLHAWGHEAAVSGAAEPTTADRLVSGMTDEQLRSQPAPGANPLVWLIWHMARIEDVAANLFVAGRPQVLDEAWMDRLSVSQHDVGTGMSDTDVVDVSAAIDVAALCAYRRAVGLRTREIFRGLSAADLGVVVDESRVRGLRAQGVLGREDGVAGGSVARQAARLLRQHDRDRAQPCPFRGGVVRSQPDGPGQ